MSIKANNNIVRPAESRTERESPLFKALQVSGANPSSKYNLSNGDRERGFYFLFGGLEVPFRAIIQVNNKVRGIASISFGTARDCPSHALGLCQLPDTTLCYARAGEKRATRRNNEDGSQGMDSIYNGLLCSVFWDAFESKASVRVAFMEFLDFMGIETIRANLKGDFRHEMDILALYHLAGYGFKITCYTARDDLADSLEFAKGENLTINGSNRKYTNRFKATDSIEEYLKASNRCLGECAGCRKCYTLKDAVITCLIHGSGSETALNNEKNQEFLLRWSREALPWDVFRDCDFSVAKGFGTCIKKHLDKVGLLVRPSTTKELIKFIEEMGGI